MPLPALHSMTAHPLTVIAILLLALRQSVGLAETSETQDIAEQRFELGVYEDELGGTLRYRLAKPAKPDSPMPLLLFLHGAGERGSDNQRQLFWGKDVLLKAVDEYNCIVVVPQCPDGAKWSIADWEKEELAFADMPSNPMRMTQELIDSLIETHDIDTDRLYIMGLSMGGYGTWDAICRWPDRFAAAVPICGGGDPAVADRIRTPVWVFHGDADTVVPPERSRVMVDALREAGSEPTYTEYPDVGHNSWSPAFADPDLLPWITSKRLVNETHKESTSE